MAVVGVVVIALLAVLLLVAFPPRGARWWRRLTRPIRRRLRPGHYRTW